MQIAEPLRRHLDAEYRSLVESLADGAALNPSSAVKTLAGVQRSPEQLAADVARLLSRRLDVGQLADVERLTQDLERAQEAYRAAVVAEETARTELARADSGKAKCDTLENRLRCNECRHLLADAREASGFAFHALESVRKRRDALRDELTARLEKTAIAGTDATVAANFLYS